MTTYKRKAIKLMIGSGSVSLVILFFLLCSILGINSRRKAFARNFIQDLFTQDSSSFSVLTENLQKDFFDNEQIYGYSVRAFLLDNFPDTASSEYKFPYRLHVRNPFVLRSYSGQELVMLVYFIRTDQPHLDIIREQASLYLHGAEADKKYKKISLVCKYNQGKWKVKTCKSGKSELHLLTSSHFELLSKQLSRDELITVGNLFKDINYQIAMKSFEMFYEKLTSWDSSTKAALDQLARYWIEQNDSRGEQLSSRLNNP